MAPRYESAMMHANVTDIIMGLVNAIILWPFLKLSRMTAAESLNIACCWSSLT